MKLNTHLRHISCFINAWSHTSTPHMFWVTYITFRNLFLIIYVDVEMNVSPLTFVPCRKCYCFCFPFPTPPHFGSNSKLKIIIWRCCCFAHTLCLRRMKSAWWSLCVHIYCKKSMFWRKPQFSFMTSVAARVDWKCLRRGHVNLTLQSTLVSVCTTTFNLLKLSDYFTYHQV